MYIARQAAALFPRKTGPAPGADRRDRVRAARRVLLAQTRTWSSAQLAEALRPRGIARSGRQVRRYLRGLGAGYRRTVTSVQHKQNPARVARAKVVLGLTRKKTRGLS